MADSRIFTGDRNFDQSSGVAEESTNLGFLGSWPTLDLAATASAEKVKLDKRFCKLCVLFKNRKGKF